MSVRSLSHYELLEEIGSGGMGVVYKARDRHLERFVAIKVLPAGTLANEAARQRFRKEALALSRLNHPNIATVHDFDTEHGVDFLVLEYIPGVTLNDRLACGALPQPEILRLGLQLAQGLATAHAHGVVHRDLKPGNLRVTAEGAIKILDFGLALLRPREGDSATVTIEDSRRACGTLPYMAPEQLRGESADARSDIYAAGAVLYEMAAGRRAFPQSESAQLITAALHQMPAAPSTHNPRISPALESVILKCLDKDPARRYQSAKELAVDLERLSAPVPSPVASAPRAAPRRRLLALGAAAVVVIALLIVILQLITGRAGAPRIESIAVLPLANLTGDPAQEYFADGMTEALITDLAKIAALRVISHTSVLQYKAARKPLPEIARALRVDAVVEGSVLRAGDRVRITAQLIEARTDRHLWADSYERDLRDILTLQREVARAIANEISVKVTPQERQRLAGARAVKPEAYEAYLKGRFAWNRQTDESLTKAVEFFNQAIAEDPSYAQAYAGLADSLFVRGIMFSSLSNVWKGVRQAALKARDLDETAAEAHTSVALLTAFIEWHWAEGEREFERAIELNPGLGDARHWYAHLLHATGRIDEAVAEIGRAQAVDPLSLPISRCVARVHFLNRQYDRALQESRKALDLDPTFSSAYRELGRAYEQKGKFAEAVTAFRKAAAGPGAESAMGDLGHAYARAGNGAEALKVIADLDERSKSRFVSAFDPAMVYIGLGDKDRAFEWLEKAFEERSYYLIYSAQVDPRFDSLRSDPRFTRLLERMGLSAPR